MLSAIPRDSLASAQREEELVYNHAAFQSRYDRRLASGHTARPRLGFGMPHPWAMRTISRSSGMFANALRLFGDLTRLTCDTDKSRIWRDVDDARFGEHDIAERCK